MYIFNLQSRLNIFKFEDITAYKSYMFIMFNNTYMAYIKVLLLKYTEFYYNNYINFVYDTCNYVK